MSSTYVVFKIFFKNIVKEKFFQFIFISGLVFGFLSILLNEISYGANEKIIRSFSLGFLSFLTIFLSIFTGLTNFNSERMKHSIIVLCTKPIRRFEIVIGATFAYQVALLIGILVTCLEFKFILGITQVNFDNFFLLGVLGIALEAIIIFQLTVLFSFFTKPLINSVFVVSYYIFSHGVAEVLEMGLIKNNEIIRKIIYFGNKLAPNLPYFNFKDMVYTSNSFDGVFFGFTYFAVSFFALLGISCYLFARKDHY